MQSNTTSDKLHMLLAGCQSGCRYHQTPARLREADATRSDLQSEIWFQVSPIAELAALAASCLIDLLMLGSLSFSPKSVSAPAASKLVKVSHTL